MTEICVIQLYLDPNIGSMMIQFIIAFLVGIAIFFRQLKEKVKSVLRFIFGKDKNENDQKS